MDPRTPRLPDSDELRAAAFAFLDDLIQHKAPYLRRNEVNEAVLEQIVGPMLRHCLQDGHRAEIRLPRKRSHHPDRDRLRWTYDRVRDRVS